MDDEILEGIVMVADEPIEQTAEEALASIMMAAINEGIAMDPVVAAAHMRKYLAEHDAGLIEQLAGTLPAFWRSGIRMIPLVSLEEEAKRRRALP